MGMGQRANKLNALTVEVEVSPDHVRACFEDCRERIVARFGELNSAQVEQLARDSWQIGTVLLDLSRGHPTRVPR